MTKPVDTSKQENGPSRRSRLSHYVLIAVLGVLMLAAVAGSFFLGDQAIRTHAPQVDAIMELKLETTLAHLWFEEVMMGDQNEAIASVWEHLDEADWYAKALLEGGRNHEGTYVPLKDSAMRREIGEVRQKLAAFRDVTEKRYIAIDVSGTGTEIDQEFDAAFNDFLRQADIVETRLQTLISRKHLFFRRLQALLMALCTILTGGLFFLLLRHDRARTRHLKIITAANLQLQAQEQQLRASNQQLQAQEQKLLASNQQLLAQEQQLRAANQQLTAHEQQLRASNQQLLAQEQELKAANQQLLAHEQQLKSANEHLRSSEFRLKKEMERAQSYFDIAEVMLLVIDDRQRVVQANKKTCRILGYPEGEIVGKNWFDHFLPDSNRQEVKKVYDQLMQGKLDPVEFFENEVVTSEGSRRLIAWHNTYLTDDEGRIIGALCSGEDITDKRKASAALNSANHELRAANQQLQAHQEQLHAAMEQLAHSENLNRSIIDHIPVGMFIYHIEEGDRLIFRGFNNAASQILQVDCAELIGKTIEEAFPALAETEIPRRFRETAQEGTSWDTEQATYQDEKIAVFLIIHAFQIGPDRMVAACANFTELKKAQEEILANNQQLQTSEQQLQAANQQLMAHQEQLQATNNQLMAHEQELKTAIEKLRESEENYRTVFDSVNDSIIIHDLETGRPLDANVRCLEAFGYTYDEFLQLSISDWSDGAPPFDHNNIRARLDAAANGEAQIFQWHCRKKDGGLFWSEVSMRRTQIRGRNVLLAAYRDTTKRKQAEDRLIENEARFRLIYNNSPLPYQSLDENGNFLEVNPSFVRSLGYQNREDLVGSWFGNILGEGEADKFRERFPKFKEIGEVRDVEFRMKRQDGSLMDVEIDGRVERDDNGAFSRTHCVIRDVTERKRMRAELEASEAKLRSILQAAPDGMVLCDLAKTVIDCNPAAARMLGFKSAGEFVGKNGGDYVHPGSPELSEKYEKIFFEEGFLLNEDYMMRREDGSEFPAEVSANLIYDHDEKPARVVFVFKDVTERKRAEEALRNSEERFREIASSIRDVFWLSDMKTGKILYISPGYEKLWGRSCQSVYDHPTAWFEAIHPDDREAVRQGLGDREHRITEFRVIRPDGTARWVKTRMFPIRDESGEVVREAGVATDITDYKRAIQDVENSRSQLIQSEKMASLGTLVSGVAHEINNPNNFLILNSQIFARAWKDAAPILEKYYQEQGDFSLAGIPYSEAGEKVMRLLDGIFQGSDRIKKIVNALKDYARQESSDMNQAVDIHKAIESAVLIVHNLIKMSTDRFETELQDNLPAIKGNTQQIEQVIINLLTNSCNALQAKTRKIRISAFFSPDDNRVVIQVEDEGEGIRPENLEKLFDPFFTTRRNAGGTGLGLSISYGIIQSHSGTIEVNSELGNGTTFTIRLPVMEK